MATQKHEQYQKTIDSFNELLPTLPKEKGWWFDHLFQYQGYWLSSEPAIKGQLLMQDHFEAQPTDIILASSPKCGTTWVRALLFAIENRNKYDSASHPLLTNNPQDLVLFLEGCLTMDAFAATVHALPSPRLLSTHLPYTMFPKSVIASGCRFVYVCRDPKDLLISKWHFANKLRPKEMPRLSLQEAYELFCRGISHYGPFWDNVLSYWKASLESPEKVLFLKYENFKRDTLDYVKKLAEFIGRPFSQEEENQGKVQEIVRLCSFGNLSVLEVNNTNVTQFGAVIKNPYFFRKGQVGDWVNHLTEEMAEVVNQITNEKLLGYGLSLV